MKSLPSLASLASLSSLASLASRMLVPDSADSADSLDYQAEQAPSARRPARTNWARPSAAASDDTPTTARRADLQSRRAFHESSTRRPMPETDDAATIRD